MHQRPPGSQLPSDSDSVAGIQTGWELPIGHAWFVLDMDEDDQAMLLACERRECLEALLLHVDLNLRARTITVIIDNVAVPVVVVMLRIRAGDEVALFSAWVNALSPRTSGILDKLATQPFLPIALVDEFGHTVGTALAKNALLPRINSLRIWIEDLARTNPWTLSHFAAAKAYFRSEHPTNEDLWNLFEEDAADETEARELAEMLA